MHNRWNNEQVLMFGWELPPDNTGGLGVACHGLTRGLSQHGVPISFALPRQLSVNVSHMRVLPNLFPGVSVTAINSPITGYLDKTQYHKYLSQARARSMRMFGPSLYDEVQRFSEIALSWSQSQPHSLIHAHDWMTYPAAQRAAAFSKKPFVAHIHATEYDRTGGNVNGQIAELEYQGLSAADKVIAVSNYTKQMIKRYYLVPEEKIAVVHNGIDAVEFTPQDIRQVFPDDDIVLFVGRLTFQKGVDYFLRAAQRVLQTRPNTVFLVVGKGDMQQQLIMQAAQLGIGQRVIFTGFLQGAQLRAVYQMADAFVMPSVSEPYGLVALEAIASGTPVILSKQSGVSETLEHVMRVDFWDVSKMAQQIITILSYPSISREMVQLSQRQVQGMTWDKAARRVLSVYDSVLH